MARPSKKTTRSESKEETTTFPKDMTMEGSKDEEDDNDSQDPKDPEEDEDVVSMKNLSYEQES